MGNPNKGMTKLYMTKDVMVNMMNFRAECISSPNSKVFTMSKPQSKSCYEPRSYDGQSKAKNKMHHWQIQAPYTPKFFPSQKECSFSDTIKPTWPGKKKRHVTTSPAAPGCGNGAGNRRALRPLSAAAGRRHAGVRVAARRRLCGALQYCFTDSKLFLRADPAEGSGMPKNSSRTLRCKFVCA
jgi:hypothetical protein